MKNRVLENEKVIQCVCFCNWLYISLLNCMFFVYEKRVDPLRGIPYFSTRIDSRLYEK